VNEMTLIRCLSITSREKALREMEQTGVDTAGMRLMEGETLHFNLKVEKISSRTASLLKQEMLAAGGNAAVDERGLNRGLESTDALLMGTQKQIKRLILKLDQSPAFQPLGRRLKEALQNIRNVRYTFDVEGGR